MIYEISFHLVKLLQFYFIDQLEDILTL